MKTIRTVAALGLILGSVLAAHAAANGAASKTARLAAVLKTLSPESLESLTRCEGAFAYSVEFEQMSDRVVATCYRPDFGNWNVAVPAGTAEISAEVLSERGFVFVRGVEGMHEGTLLVDRTGRMAGSDPQNVLDRVVIHPSDWSSALGRVRAERQAEQRRIADKERTEKRLKEIEERRANAAKMLDAIRSQLQR